MMIMKMIKIIKIHPNLEETKMNNKIKNLPISRRKIIRKKKKMMMILNYLNFPVNLAKFKLKLKGYSLKGGS